MHPLMAHTTSRAEGAFLGLACGNALGLPYETIWPAAKIRTLSGGSIRDIPDDESSKPWDDETAHAMILADLLAKTGGTNPRLFAERLLQWRDANGRGMGVLTEKVLDEIEGEVDPLEASEEASERLGRNWSAGNGALVRAVPIAIFIHAGNADRAHLVHLATDATRTTHWNPLCVGSTVAYALALSDVLEGKTCDFPTLAEALGPMGFPEAVAQAVSGARLPLSAFQLDGKQKGFALKALQVGLWALHAEGSTEEILEQVILEGGDTDTNAAIAGASLGARHGVESLPERWIAKIHQPELLRKAVAELSIKRPA